MSLPYLRSRNMIIVSQKSFFLKLGLFNLALPPLKPLASLRKSFRECFYILLRQLHATTDSAPLLQPLQAQSQYPQKDRTQRHPAQR